MRKLIAAALALAALMVPLAANAVTYLGTTWGPNRPVQWVRGTALQDTVSFTGTLALASVPDTVRTAMIDATGIDWLNTTSNNGSAGPRAIVKITAISFGGVGTDTLADTLFCNIEQTFDNGTTYALNTTVQYTSPASFSSIPLVRDITNYQAVGSTVHPGIYVGYLYIDPDTNPVASVNGGGLLWLRQFRCRIVPGGSAEGSFILSRSAANTRLFVQFPEPRLDWGGHGSTFAGLEIARKQAYFLDNGAVVDTMFQTDESDTLSTLPVDFSDAYVSENLASATAGTAETVVRLTLLVTGANNGAADTVYCVPLPLVDAFLGDYLYPSSGTYPPPNAFISLIRTSLAGNMPATFIGYMKLDMDALPDGAGGAFAWGNKYKFFLSGDIGGTTPKLSGCKLFASYPRARIVRN